MKEGVSISLIKPCFNSAKYIDEALVCYATCKRNHRRRKYDKIKSGKIACAYQKRVAIGDTFFVVDITGCLDIDFKLETCLHANALSHFPVANNDTGV